MTEDPRKRAAQLTVQAVELLAQNAELQRLVRELEEVRERHDTAPIAIVMLNGPGARVLSANAAGSELLGLAPERVAGARLDVLVTSASVPELRLCLDTAVVSGRGRCEVVLAGRDVIIDARLIAGSEPSLLCSIADITAHKHSVKERLALQRRVDAMQRTESLTTCAAGLAHRLETVLATISTNLERAETGSPVQVQEALADAKHAASDASVIGQQLAMYAGGVSITRRAVDVAAMLRSIEPLTRTAVSFNAMVVFELGRETAGILGDVVRLSNVVLELVTNATEAGARVIRIGLTQRSLDADAIAALDVPQDLEPGNYAEISVTDDGPGVADSTRRRIFEPFFTTHHTGRGLGLAVADGVARAHGGALVVDMAPGAGARFRLLIPAR